MSEIADVTPLLDVVFTLNLIAPGVFKLIEAARSQITDAVVDEVQSAFPDFAVVQEDRTQLQRSVVLYFPFLRKTFKFTRFLAWASMLVASLAFGGIVWAAVGPHYRVGTPAIITAAIVGISVPVVYLGLGRFLDWASKTIIVDLKTPGSRRDFTTRYFRDFIKRNQEWAILNQRLEQALRGLQPDKSAP